jgi:3-hydroxyacyl-[acyl-carrier-protein] dehydratase
VLLKYLLRQSAILALVLSLPAVNGFGRTAFPTRSRAISGPRFAEVAEAEAEAEAAAAAEFVGAEAVSAKTSDVETVFTLEEVQKILSHRYPFALVDKVIEYEAGTRAVGVKQVTFNEPQFGGHFPDRPIMPGVMQVEALAQLAGIVCLQMEGAAPGSVFFFAAVDGVKWKKPVVPGDTLVMEVEITKWVAKFGLAKASGKAYVDGKLAVEVKEMTFALAK